MDEIVVDMTPKKGQYTSGQAYVAFSRVKELKKLHIIKYTHEQIRVSKNVAAEMDRIRRKPVPRLPEINLQPDTSSVKKSQPAILCLHDGSPDDGSAPQLVKRPGCVLSCLYDWCT